MLNLVFNMFVGAEAWVDAVLGPVASRRRRRRRRWGKKQIKITKTERRKKEEAYGNNDYVIVKPNTKTTAH